MSDNIKAIDLAIEKVKAITDKTSTAELVAIHNEAVVLITGGKPVKKFESRDAALKRMRTLLTSLCAEGDAAKAVADEAAAEEAAKAASVKRMAKELASKQKAEAGNAERTKAEKDAALAEVQAASAAARDKAEEPPLPLKSEAFKAKVREAEARVSEKRAALRAEKANRAAAKAAPKPERQPRAAKATSNGAGAPRAGELKGARLNSTCEKNPRREGSAGHASHAIVLANPGITLEDFIAKGGRIGDVRWDVEHGHMTASKG